MVEGLLAGLWYVGYGFANLFVYVSIGYFPEIITASLFLALIKLAKLKSGGVLSLCLVLVVCLYVFLRGDLLFGLIYSRYECSMRSNVQVFKTVTLSPDISNSNGWPLYMSYDINGYDINTESTEGGSSFRYGLSVETDLKYWVGSIRYSVKDNSTGEVLARVDSFRAVNGWYGRSVGVIVNSKNYCGVRPFDLEKKYTKGGADNQSNLLNLVFKKYNADG